MMNIRWNDANDFNGTSLTGYVNFPTEAGYRIAVTVLELVSGQNFAEQSCEDEPNGGMITGDLVDDAGNAIPFTLYNRGYGTCLHIGLREWDYRLDLMEALGAFFTLHQQTFTITRDARS